jgi:hypothetical protein
MNSRQPGSIHTGTVIIQFPGTHIAEPSTLTTCPVLPHSAPLRSQGTAKFEPRSPG